MTHTFAPGSYAVSLTIYYYDVESGECCKTTVIRDIFVSPNGQAGISTPLAPKKTELAPMPEWLIEQPSLAAVNANVELFPNPSNGTFTVSSSDERIEKVIIHDLSGRAFQTINAEGNANVRIDFGSEAPGTYSVSVYFVSGETVTKQIVRR